MTLSASTLADGVYRICTNMDTSLVCDISYISKSDCADMFLGGNNGGNNQVYRMETWNTDYKRFHPVHSGKDIDGFGRVNLQGDENLLQNTWNGGANQYWSLKHYADKNVEGEVVYCSNNSAICWDVQYAISKSGSNITMSPAHPGTGVNLGRNQLWTFVKDSMLDAKLSVPASVGWTSLANGVIRSPYATVGANANGATRFFAWTGAGTDHQVRYRWRGRYTGTDNWGDWSSWMSMADDSTTDEGWGNAWAKNQTAQASGSIRYTDRSLTVVNDQGTYDRKDYQVQVRRTGTNSTYGLTHGASATGTLKLLYYPTMSLSKAEVQVGGLRIAYASDFRRAGNAITVNGVTVGGTNILKSAYTVKSVGYSSSILIPWKYLTTTPASGASAAVSMTIATMDGYVRTQSITQAVTWSSDYAAATALPTITDADGLEKRVTFPASSADRTCVLVWKEGGKWLSDDCEELTDDEVFRVIPPVGVDWWLKYAATNSSNAKVWWATVKQTKVTGDSCWWNLDDGNKVEGFLSDGTMDWPRSVEPDSAAYLCNGDEYESVYFSGGAKSTISADFVFPISAVGGREQSTYDESLRLQRGVYAVFRTPEGDRYRVAVTGVSTKRVTKEYRVVSVSMRVCE